MFDRVGAETDYSKAIELDPSAERYLARANFRSEGGDHAGSLKDAQAAYDLEQGNNDVRDRLALELAEAGKLQEGLDLLPVEPDRSTDDGLSTFLFRIYVLETGNDHAEAMALLNHALETGQSAANLYNSAAGTRRFAMTISMGRWPIATVLSACPRIQPPNLDSRGMVHFRAGRLEQARRL